MTFPERFSPATRYLSDFTSSILQSSPCIKREEIKTQKPWNSSFVLLILKNALQIAGFTMIIPVLPKYAVDIGASLAVAGLVSGLFFKPLLAEFSVDFRLKRYVLKCGVCIDFFAASFTKFFQLRHDILDDLFSD